MCGRMNVTDHEGIRTLFREFGLAFDTPVNSNLSPSQAVQSCILDNQKLKQLELQWGIQPSWSKKLLINAKSETVNEKRTFKQSFELRRCVVPCTGWYEWKDEGGSRKQKYLFESVSGEPILMGGIWYDYETPQLVTLTTNPNSKCG